MKPTNIIILIAALIPVLRMVEGATIEEQINEIIDHDNSPLTDTDANTILTTTSETALKDIYDKFLVRKKAIKDYIIDSATPEAQKQRGYKSLLLLLAAFETKKPRPTVTDPEKQRIVPGILKILPGTTDKTTMEGLLSTSSSLSNPEKEFTRTGTKPDYDMIDLLAAAHRMRLHMPDPGTANTPEEIKNIRAIGRLTQLVNELIPTTTDYLQFSIEVARLIDTENKNPLLHYNPTAKNDLLELDREYAWRKTLLDLSIAGRMQPSDSGDITRMNDANKKLQDEFNKALPTAIIKVQNDFSTTTNSRKLANVILSQMPTDPDLAAVIKERQRIDGILIATVTAPAKPDEEAALAIEEALLYAKLDATDYAPSGLTDAQKTTAREPAIHDAMNFRRLHIQKKYKEMLDDPTKEKSADKVQEKTKELKDKQAAFDPKTNNDEDINKAIDEAIKKIEDAAIQLFPPNPPPGPNPQPNPNPAPQPGPQPAPAPQQPQDPDVVKALDMEFDNNPPEKVPANQCQDIGTNCGDIMRMCGIPAYVLRMHQNCKRTCRACFPDGEPCQDQFPADCKMWEAEGYCKSRIPKALKMVQCPVTCGLCPN